MKVIFNTTDVTDIDFMDAAEGAYKPYAVSFEAEAVIRAYRVVRDQYLALGALLDECIDDEARVIALPNQLVEMKRAKA